jgi:tetratricopeptide (TPR) repeat protein
LIFGFGKKKKKKEDDRSTRINGSATNSPILSGEFHESVTISYGLQQQQLAEKASEYKRPPKPSIFRAESPIFVGRQQDIAKMKQYLTAESNAPVSITGEGGIGKSALAFKAIHECEDMFDVIIPVYFESLLTFNSFLFEMGKSVQLPMTIDQFEQVDNIEEKAQIIKDALARYRKVLIYADSYETIRNSIITVNKSSTTQQSRGEEDAIKINNFLKHVPKSTYVLLTSRQRRNLTGERTVPLEGLSVQEGYDLFIKVAGDKFPKNIPIEMKEAIEEISKKTGGHPLSIEILASTYGEDLLPGLRGMLKNLGAGVVNQEETEDSHHRSLEASFGYSICKLPETHRLLLPKIAVMFNSPFPAYAVESIFGSSELVIRAADIIRDLYDSSLLRRINFDERGDIEGKYRLYYFHPSVRNYLEYKAQENNRNELEEKYGDQFPQYYYTFIEETYKAIGTKDYVLSLERFNVILFQGKDNDFDRAISLAKDRSLASAISTNLGLVLVGLGMYGEARKYHEKALAIDQELNDRLEMARDYRLIGNVLYNQRDYNQRDYGEALNYYNKSLEIHQELNNRLEMARDYRSIGNVLRNPGNQNQPNYELALEYHEKALAIDQELNNRPEMAGDYRSIGNVHESQGNYDQAKQNLMKALAIDQELNDRLEMAGDYRLEMARDYRLIGNVLYNQNDYGEALNYYNKSLEIHQELNNRLEMARDYHNMGFALHNQDKSQQALQYLEKAKVILQELEKKTGYHYPRIDLIQQRISQIEEKKGKAN